MRWIHAVAAAVAATGLAASVAKATLTVSVVPIGIDPAAVSADSNLSNARAFDLRVTQTGEKWNVTTMQTTLGTGGNLNGTFYQAPSGALISHGAHVFQQGFAPTTPQYYDTSFNVTMNNSARTDILGDSDYPAAGSGTTAVQSTNQLSVAWGDHDASTNTTTDGSFSIGRITIKGNTGAYLNGYVAGNAQLNNAQIFHNVYVPIQGDVNLDGLTNQLDLNVVIGHFGQAGNYGVGDLNGDGLINQLDLNQVIGGFGNGIAAPPGAALGSLVPEPATLGLAICGVFGLCLRRGRQSK